MNRARHGVIGLLALALVVVAGCTVKQKEPTVTFEEAQRRVVALVDETLAAALPTLRLGQPDWIGRHPCNDAFGAPSQNVSLDFERSFPIDGPPAERLLADTERVWRERGYPVDRDDSDQQVSFRNTTVDGYAMALVVNRTDKRARLGASSPCVRPPSGT
jgi:hypothetical protein